MQLLFLKTTAIDETALLISELSKLFNWTQLSSDIQKLWK